jgi:hypothetical protein
MTVFHKKMISNEREAHSQMRTSGNAKWQRPEPNYRGTAISEDNVNATTKKVRQYIMAPGGNRIESSDDVLCLPVCCDESIDNAKSTEESQICPDDETCCIITNQHLGSQEGEMFDWDGTEEPSALPSIQKEDEEAKDKPSLFLSFSMDPVSFS